MVSVVAMGLFTVFCISDFLYQGGQWNIVRAACLVAAVCMLPWSQTVLGVKPLRWLGGISMNVYLLHMTVIGIVTQRMAAVMGGGLLNFVVMFIVTAAVTIVVSYAYAVWVESRLNRLVDKFLALLK